MNKRSSFLVFLVIGLIIGNLYGYGNSSEADTDQLSEFSISGTCGSGISNLYITENSNYDLFGSGNYKFSWSKGTIINNMNMTLAALHAIVTDLQGPLYSLIASFLKINSPSN